jgi:hypothetical protein
MLDGVDPFNRIEAIYILSYRPNQIKQLQVYILGAFTRVMLSFFTLFDIYYISLSSPFKPDIPINK